MEIKNQQIIQIKAKAEYYIKTKTQFNILLINLQNLPKTCINKENKINYSKKTNIILRKTIQ